MALGLASPGIKIREVDLTRGGINNTTVLSAGIAAPFEKGPVNQIITINTENDLVKTFGRPYKEDYHYEYWYSASNFLGYGGSLKVVRCSGNNLNNANAGVGTTSVAVLKIENYDDYEDNYSTDNSFFWAAKNPGYWADGIKVCVIDNFADQTISGIQTTSFAVGYGLTQSISGNIAGVGTTSAAQGYIKGIITGIGQSSIDVKILSKVVSGTETAQAYTENSTYEFKSGTQVSVRNAAETTTTTTFITQTTGTFNVNYDNIIGITTTLLAVGDVIDGTYINPGTTILEIGAGTITISESSSVTGLGTTGTATSTLNFNRISTTSNAAVGVFTSFTASDWYNSQNILDISKGDNTTIPWSSVAPKPTTNQYVVERNGADDALHVVVFDSKKLKSVSGVPQAILEKFVNLSKAVDGLTSPSQKIYYKDYLAQYSEYLFAGKVLGNASDSIWGISPAVSKFSAGFTPQTLSSGNWGSEADGVYYNVIGNKSFTLTAGKDYSGVGNVGGLSADLESLSEAYDRFSSDSDADVRFLLQGSASLGKVEEQAKANKLIAIAEARKDCIAFISPYRESVVNVTSPATQLLNVLSFFSPIQSSSYAVFDSGYQYVYDRFNQQFVYIPCSSDVAGLCVRTDIDQFPWFSPAGKSRGTFKSAIKLAYNPGQTDRDKLYGERINPVITSPGAGIILFGDKTALKYQSAFDRINVRRLFIAIQQAIKTAADAQLFEFNDATTRANFINVVEPYLRDVKIKRGITDFLLICDESNNTADVIDRNEFIADIYVKPARSINFIGLTFVATRTGVSFESIVGTV